MFFKSVLFFALLEVAYAQQVCPDGTAPAGPCPCQPGYECIPIINQCCAKRSTVVLANFTVAPIRPVMSAAPTTVDPATACDDRVNPKTKKSDCSTLVALCDVAQYRTLMIEQCPKTCKRCASPRTPITKCVDLLNPKTNVSDCPARRNLCDNKVYEEIMKVQCPRTCNLCTPTTITTRMMMPLNRREPGDDIMEKLVNVSQENKKQELSATFGRVKLSVRDRNNDEIY